MKVLRRWSTAKSAKENVRRWYHLKTRGADWHHRTHCHVHGKVSMACAKYDMLLCASFVAPFFGVYLLDLETRLSLQSNFNFHDLRENLENDEAIQSSGLAEHVYSLSNLWLHFQAAVINRTNLHTSPDPHCTQHCASVHFVALAWCLSGECISWHLIRSHFCWGLVDACIKCHVVLMWKR